MPPPRRPQKEGIIIVPTSLECYKYHIIVVVVQSLTRSNSLRSLELQHTRLPCPSPFPRVCLDSYPLSQCCSPTISASVALFSSCPQYFPASRSFSSELALHIRWPKDWSFSISPSNEYSRLISFRIDWFDLLAIQETQLRAFIIAFAPGNLH